MARDSKTALVALNRFGFGARGGASGDFVNAASDPRGFVKAELSRPNGVLLEVPSLSSTAALGKAVFDYQFEIKQARDAASKSGAPATATEGPPQQASPDARVQRRNLSLTEFGRTARINGTEGTDHGTGTIALLAGGAVKGGRMIADWPRLKPANLYQGRDLAPTTDLRAVMKGVLHDQFGLTERVLAEQVFPDSAPVKPMKGLVG